MTASQHDAVVYRCLRDSRRHWSCLPKKKLEYILILITEKTAFLSADYRILDSRNFFKEGPWFAEILDTITWKGYIPGELTSREVCPSIPWGHSPVIGYGSGKPHMSSALLFCGTTFKQTSATWVWIKGHGLGFYSRLQLHIPQPRVTTAQDIEYYSYTRFFFFTTL